MRRLIVSFILILCTALLCGCAARYESLADADLQGARLPRGVRIDGADISGMTIAEARTVLKELHAQTEKEAVFTVSTSDGVVRFNASDLGAAWDTEEVLLKALNASALSAQSKAYRCQMRLHNESCRGALHTLTAQLCKAPSDAMAAYAKGGFTYTEAQAGYAVDTAALAQAVAASLDAGGALDAAVTQIEPSYTTAQAKADTVLLSSFTTSFAGGTYGKTNRVYNIRKAAQHIDGFIIEPGGEFNMNDALGDRTGKNGWRKATAIRYGVYVDEYGGGVCQVSTTLYNAVLLACLPVTERHHHTWPLGYVDAGRDATISTDGPNFRFRNDTAKPVYISAITDTDAKTITVKLFGNAPADGRKVKLSAKRVEKLADPGYKLTVDNTLAANTILVERESRGGSVSEVYRLFYDETGKLMERELIGRDKYRPVKGILRVSPDQEKRARAAYDIS